MAQNVVVAGVGMTSFSKPGEGPGYAELGETAVRGALADAGIGFEQLQEAYAGYVYGDSTSGQAALYRVGRTGIPVVNVNNNCSSGSSALWLAHNAVRSGMVDCAIAMGFEQMPRGPIAMHWDDRSGPLDELLKAVEDVTGPRPDLPMALKLYGAAAQQYQERYGTSATALAQISVKARRHAEHNPHAVFRTPLTVEEVLASPTLAGPLTRLQCCPPTCGGAAVILCSEDFARRHDVEAGVRVRAQALTTDTPATFDSGDLADVIGYDMTARAAAAVYEKAGVGPEDLSVVELHDCFTIAEAMTYEALGLTPRGTVEKFVDAGDNTYGGRVVVNPSGGLLAKGHPLGATGLAQIAELVWQLRGVAHGRQVDGARLALQHNQGLGGATVVTLLERAA